MEWWKWVIISIGIWSFLIYLILGGFRVGNLSRTARGRKIENIEEID